MSRSRMSEQVEQYLAFRRAMGFDLRGEGYQLHAFARFADETGRHTGPLTTDLLLRWVQTAKKPGPVTAARRVEVLRPFLKYYRQFDPACPVLPLGLCGPAHRRISPHIYTEAEISELLAAAHELKPDGPRPLTYVTLFGILAATGMRLSEALHLEQADVNLKQSALTVRETKFKKSRLVPLHSSATEALSRYAKACVTISRQPGVRTFFLTASGRSIPHRTVHHTFDVLRRRLGWVARGGHPQPRIHDLRHTFICRALLRGQQQNQLDHVADAIATYVGHAKVSDTYWYVTAIPELMGIASERFSRFSSERMPMKSTPQTHFAKSGTGVLSRSSDSPAELQSTNCGGLSRLFPAIVRVCPRTPKQAYRPFGPRRSRCFSGPGVFGSSRESPEKLHPQSERPIGGDTVLLAFCGSEGPAIAGHHPARARHPDETSQPAVGWVPVARRGTSANQCSRSFHTIRTTRSGFLGHTLQHRRSRV